MAEARARRRSQSIGRTFVQILLLGILVPAGLIWALGHVTAQGAVSSLWESLSDEIADHAVESTLRYLETGPTALAYNDALLALGLTAPAERRAMLRYLHAGLVANPNVTWYSFGTADGAYLSAYRPPEGGVRITWREQVEGGARYRDFRVEPDGTWTALPEQVKPYDPRTRVWYEEAVATDAAVWSKPFLFASGPPGFILSRRARGADGEVAGVWGIEYEMAAVSHFLAGLEVGGRGRAMLITAAGEVIGHPLVEFGAPDGWIVVERDGTKAIATLDAHRDAWLRGAVATARGGGGERSAFDADGERFLYVLRPFPAASGLDWRVVVVVPEADILGRVHRNALLAALAAAGIAACFLVLGILLTRRRLSGPLGAIAADFEEMARLDTDREPAIASSRLTELVGMIEARETMRAGLRSFKRYVPAKLVRDLFASGLEARLGGEARTLTVMFVDLADFTAISEAIRDPGELVHALSEYLDVMSAAVRDHGGTVDKYIGDAVMAFWGAPAPLPAHAERACEAAWTAQRLLAGLRRRLAAEGKPPFHARIGINTGEVLVGNIGSAERMNYTVMGDPVNLASRLEGICKLYDLEIAVGPATAAAVVERFDLRPVDCVEVKGRREAVVFHELLGRKGETGSERLAFAATYGEAFAQYRARAFAEAQAGFERALALHPGDRSAEILRDRCTAYLDDPPPSDWTGAYRLTRKR